MTLGVGDQLTGRALGHVSGFGHAVGWQHRLEGAAPRRCRQLRRQRQRTPPPRPNACATTAPDLFITKTHVDPFVVGSNGTYRIALGNNGVTSIGPITVTDTLPATRRVRLCLRDRVDMCRQPDRLFHVRRRRRCPGMITLTVTPGANAAPSVTNNAAVSGGVRLRSDQQRVE